jgi:hypothetical protein
MALRDPGRGGRRRRYLTVPDERALLKLLLEAARPNEVLEARTVQEAYEKEVAPFRDHHLQNAHSERLAPGTPGLRRRRPNLGSQPAPNRRNWARKLSGAMSRAAVRGNEG